MTASASAPAAAPAVRIAGLTVSYRRRARLLRVLLSLIHISEPTRP